MLSLGTSVVSRDLVDAITGVNSMEIVRVASTYVGVGVAQIFINAVKSRLSLKVRLKVTNEIRADMLIPGQGPLQFTVDEYIEDINTDTAGGEQDADWPDRWRRNRGAAAGLSGFC